MVRRTGQNMPTVLPLPRLASLCLCYLRIYIAVYGDEAIINMPEATKIQINFACTDHIVVRIIQAQKLRSFGAHENLSKINALI